MNEVLRDATSSAFIAVHAVVIAVSKDSFALTL